MIKRNGKQQTTASSAQASAQASMDQFFGFLYLDDYGGKVGSDPRIDHLAKRDLESCGVNLARLEAGVAALMGTRPTEKLAWLDRARKSQAKFEEKLRTTSAGLQRTIDESREMLKAMLSGQLGIGAQAHAQVFFRNRKPEEMSAPDLNSFLDDFELLQSMDGDTDSGEPSQKPQKPGGPGSAGRGNPRRR